MAPWGKFWVLRDKVSDLIMNVQEHLGEGSCWTMLISKFGAAGSSCLMIGDPDVRFGSSSHKVHERAEVSAKLKFRV